MKKFYQISIDQIQFEMSLPHKMKQSLNVFFGAIYEIIGTLRSVLSGKVANSLYSTRSGKLDYCKLWQFRSFLVPP